jgi:hypothetical protein
VTTGTAKRVTTTSATLSGIVDPEGQPTTYYFQYGPSTAYTSRTPDGSAGAGTKNVAASATVGSLTRNTVYHYRLVATNASGSAIGTDRTFTTAASAAGITIAAAPNPIIAGVATRITGMVLPPKNAHVIVTLQDSASATGPFVNVGTTGTSVTGAFSFSGLVPLTNTYYRVLASGISSRTALVAVRFRITLVARSHPRAGSLVRFHGAVTPRHRLRVRIQLLGSDGHWHTIARVRLRRARGNRAKYSTLLRVERSGRYRAIVGPDGSNLRGQSGVIRISVK